MTKLQKFTFEAFLRLIMDNMILSSEVDNIINDDEVYGLDAVLVYDTVLAYMVEQNMCTDQETGNFVEERRPIGYS